MIGSGLLRGRRDQPFRELTLEGEHGRGIALAVTPNRQAVVFLPPLGRARASAQETGDILPAVQATPETVFDVVVISHGKQERQ